MLFLQFILVLVLVGFHPVIFSFCSVFVSEITKVDYFSFSITGSY